MNKKITTIFSVFLYIVATLYVSYIIYVCFNTAHYILNLKKQGQLDSTGSIYNILNFYIPNIAHYFFYSIILFILGRGTQKLTPKTNYPKQTSYKDGSDTIKSDNEMKQANDEEVLKIWFNELKNKKNK